MRFNNFLGKKLCGLMLLVFLIGSHYSDAQSWQPLGPNDDNCLTPYRAQISSIVTDRSGIPYIAFQDESNDFKATVRKFNGTKWLDVGVPGFSSASVGCISLVIDRNDNMYVAYVETLATERVIVKKYNGSSWTDLGTTGFSSYSVDGSYVSLAIDGNGIPYLAYRDLSFGGKATVKKYNGINWVNVGAPGFSAGNVLFVSIAVDANSTPYIAYRDNFFFSENKTVVKKYNGSAWVTLGSESPSVGQAYYISIAIDKNGVPYLAFDDYAYTYKASVKKFVNGNWQYVGPVSLSSGGAFWLSMALDNNGIPYVSYQDANKNNKATVRKFNGSGWTDVGPSGFSTDEVNTTAIGIGADGTIFTCFGSRGEARKYDGNKWVYLGTPGFSDVTASYTSLALNTAGTPYVAYCDGYNGFKVTVKKFEANSWDVVGLPGLSEVSASRTSMVVSNNNVPYVGYAGGGNTITVKKFNGTAWENVGTPGFSTGAIRDLSMAIDKSEMVYVAYNDNANGNKGYVKRYTGTAWVSVGTPVISTGEAGNISLKIDPNGILYVAFRDVTNNNKATVKKFDGVNWVTVGTPGFSFGQSFNLSLAIDNSGVPYVAYADFVSAQGAKTTVKKFSGNSWIDVGPPRFSASYTTFYWIRTDASGVPYIAYSEDATRNKAIIKKYVGGSWIDVGTPASYGRASYLSMDLTTSGVPVIAYSNIYAFAKAFLSPLNLGALKAEKTSESTVKLTWATYDERGILYFDVQHSTDSISFQSIGSVNAKSGLGILTDSNNYQFVHTAPKKGNNYYRVKAIGVYGYEKLSNTALVNFDADFLAVVFPNPLSDQSFLSVYISQQSAIGIRLLDMTGKLLWRAKVFLNQGSNRLNVPFANWPHGIYLLETSLPSGERRTIKLLK